MLFPQPSSTQPFSFSTPLKLRLVAYFRDNYGLDVRDDEADLFLRTLANVYDALSKDSRLIPGNSKQGNPEGGTRSGRLQGLDI